MRRLVGEHTYESGYTKIACHFDELTKSEYATMLRNRVNNFVVVNKRIMNPIDMIDEKCYYLWINDPAGEMVANVRIQPNHVAMYTDPIRKYCIWDRAWITDPTVSLFPIPEFSNANAYIWTPDWIKRINGCSNSIMDMYEDTHSVIMFFQKHMKGLRYLESKPDKWGFDGFKWVYEEIPLEEAQPIIRKYIESQIESELSSTTTLTA